MKTVWGQPHGGSNPSASAKTKNTTLCGVFRFVWALWSREAPLQIRLRICEKVLNPSASPSKAPLRFFDLDSYFLEFFIRIFWLKVVMCKIMVKIKKNEEKRRRVLTNVEMCDNISVE